MLMRPLIVKTGDGGEQGLNFTGGVGKDGRREKQDLAIRRCEVRFGRLCGRAVVVDVGRGTWDVEQNHRNQR